MSLCGDGALPRPDESKTRPHTETVRFDIVTIFPEFFRGPLDYGIVRRAREAGLIEIDIHDLRDYTHDRHRTVDDRPFGGGEGMVLKPEPIFECMASLGVAPKCERVSGRGTAPAPDESSLDPLKPKSGLNGPPSTTQGPSTVQSTAFAVFCFGRDDRVGEPAACVIRGRRTGELSPALSTAASTFHGNFLLIRRNTSTSLSHAGTIWSGCARNGWPKRMRATRHKYFSIQKHFFAA